MKVLLTGASGFIGSRVCQLVASTDADLYLLLRTGATPGLALPAEPHLIADLNDFERVRTIVNDLKPDLVIHLAWNLCGNYQSDLHNISSLHATLHLARCAADAGCGRFVGVGTCFEYDTSLGRLSESSPTRPTTLYGSCKLAALVALQGLRITTGMKIAWARVFYVYGQREARNRLVPQIVCALLEGRPAELTTGIQVKDFLHVDDVAEAIRSIAFSDLTGPVNVGSGIATQVREIAEKIGHIIGRLELLRLGAKPTPPSDPPVICAENALLKSTGWRMQYSLEEGLWRCVEWWRAQPS